MEAYLDNSATTPLCPEAAEAMQEAVGRFWGNPSSLHRFGLEAERLLARCRADVAASLRCSPAEVTFTSGGTESNNLALFGAAAALKRRGRRVVTSAVEHSSIAESAAELQNRGFEVAYLNVDGQGRVSEQELQRLVTKDTILVSLMAVNNEVGTIQPIDAVRRVLRQANAPALIHCDAVQAYGKLPVNPQRLGVDLLTVSSHKIHGPKGAGALFVRRGVRISPILFGGSQEQKLRPGTEAVPAIAGFAAAARAIPDLQQSLQYVTGLRERLVQGLSTMEGVKLNSPPDALPYLTNISLPGLQSETMLNFLSERGVYVSSGSACAKGKKSRVLRAMALSDPDIAGALRISLSRFTTWEEIDAFLFALNEARISLARK
ncbi:MAG: cysteine desulfurase [Oscillospiraceae bacterium]|jgi:cysteine desulfurase|nr:cysteine desulfurase [Oscillospiraceae bacterium]